MTGSKRSARVLSHPWNASSETSGQHWSGVFVFDIDHVNRDPADNRWSNLRAATESQNLANTGKNKRNTSGFKRVHKLKGQQKWVSSITVDGVNYHLGTFNSPEEAHAAYVAAAKKLRGEFACAG